MGKLAFFAIVELKCGFHLMSAFSYMRFADSRVSWSVLFKVEAIYALLLIGEHPWPFYYIHEQYSLAVHSPR